jgi:hypothetical protein
MSRVALVLDGVLHTAALGEAAAGAGGPGPGGRAGGGEPSYLVTVPEERLSGLRDKLVEVASLVHSARSEAEYQAFRAAQVLRDAIARLEADLAAARGGLAERDAAIARLQDEARLLERKVVKVRRGGVPGTQG